MSCLLPASLPLRGEQEAVPHSDDGGGRHHLGLAQRIPLKESLTNTRVSRDPPRMGKGCSGGTLRVVGRIGRPGTQGIWSFAGVGTKPSSG
jgi:hypothetical protein